MRGKAFLAPYMIFISTTLLAGDFPDFITKNRKYYITRFDKVPAVSADTYRLDVKDFVENPQEQKRDRRPVYEW
jgi:hypothetical protein